MPDVVEVITKLAANFTKLIELMLSKEIKASCKHSNVAPECDCMDSTDYNKIKAQFQSEISIGEFQVLTIVPLAVECGRLEREQPLQQQPPPPTSSGVPFKFQPQPQQQVKSFPVTMNEIIVLYVDLRIKAISF